MEKYFSFKINCASETREFLIAELAAIGFDGFDESEEILEAFVPANDFNNALWLPILTQYQITEAEITKTEIEPKNWNAEWEANYQPIAVNQVYVRAPFHKSDPSFKHELIIQPKNTFGTGHHQTTQLMLELMQNQIMINASVFDYGCGTGVLGLMALKLGTKNAIGNDIDHWCIDNIEENKQLNQLSSFEFRLGGLAVLNATEKFDIIFANINKNILLESFETLAKHLNQNGHLMISGFYQTDLNDLTTAAQNFGLKLTKSITKDQWCAAILSSH